ncbi:MAG TPA: RIP metalloprotease RseP [Chitinophagaceae bacterium]|nr:RIP metalloprotease RseP [Chitinophagaceae bacterium]
MTLLAIDWNVVGIKAGQLVLCLSILVILHELGHFLPAKWFKCRVEKFYLFFDPWFSLFKKKIGETVYGIGWLPFGGYVKISGMIDESMDKEQLKEPAQPWEFRSKPAWQRLIIMVGGVTVNLILGFFIFAMILWVWGEEYLPAKNVKYGVYADSLAKSIGIKDRDVIVGVNGKELDNFASLPSEIILNEAQNIQLLRDGKPMDLPIPEGTIRSIIKRKGDPMVVPNFPCVVDTINKKVANFVSGELKRGDEIIALNDVPIYSYPQLSDVKQKLVNTEVALKVLRNGTDTVMVIAKTDKNASIGFLAVAMDKYLDFTTKKYSFFQSLPAGVKKGWATLVINVKNFKLLFTSKEVKASESLGSFISIGGMFGASWDWQRFWSMTALLSIVLAFMNILPIPALDGGHVVFTIYEMITGHKPSDKFMEYAQMVGMVLLLGLMAYALGLDIFRLFK